jgi:hypothetical protein
MQLAFSDGSHIIDNPTQYTAAHRRLGVGNLPAQDQQIAGIAATAVTTTIGILAALHTVILGVAFAGPVGAAIAGIAAVGIAIANLFGGCGQTCVAATHIADQAGALIDEAYNHYMNSPVHYESMQRAYLTLFDGTWAALTKACSNPSLGPAGQRCISDRERGSCAYQTSPGGWQQDASGWHFVDYGANGSGTTCWNSFVGRRDPVANDPTVVPDPVGAVIDPTTGAVTSIAPSLFGGSGGASVMPLLLIGGAGIAAVMLLGKD